MPYYMYFPFKESQLSEEERAAKDRWLHNERINHKDVIILYHGDKLSHIPSNAKIYISLHGTSQANYNVTDGKNTISVQEIARRMIADGLLDDPKILRLKLFFVITSTKHYQSLKLFCRRYGLSPNLSKAAYVWIIILIIY